MEAHQEFYGRLLSKLNTLSSELADSSHTYWNGVKVWVGSVVDENDYHIIIDTAEGNHYEVILYEDGTLECLTPPKT